MEYNYELYHHGVKGMKWGIRRYQKKDGTLTSAGKKRYSDSDAEARAERNKRIAKRVLGASIMGATVAAAATIYARNPEAVNKVVSKVGRTTVKALKSGSKKAITVGKKYVKEAINSAKEGVKEGIKQAPKKAAQAIVTGVVMNAAKRALDSAVGKEESARIFQANNNKKISSFWKVNDREDKDDD